MRVCAVNSMKTASCTSRPRSWYCSLASTTIERPSGVSSASEESCAASASVCTSTPATGTNSLACRLPRVMVPVLSSSRVLTSPAASTARPDIASTLRCTRRSIPAMPIAESSAPIVVGMSATTSATRIDQGLRGARVEGEGLQGDHGQQEDDGQRGEQDVQRDLVGRLLPRGALDQCDHPIDEGLTGLVVIFTTIRSESTLVPPVTAERSPPDSRMTGADSPVIADSSTEATPSTTSPSPGMT